jgi:PAS domain S-box-containing protein
MKRKILLYVILFVSALVMPQNKEYKTIYAGTLTDYPPFCITDAEGKPDGFAVELLREVCRAVNIEVEIKIGEFIRVREDLEDGKIDVMPMISKTPERANKYGFTSPYLTMRGAVFAKRDNSSINSIEDLKDKKVAVLKGTQSETYITNTIKVGSILTISTNEDAFRALINGECDAVVTQKLMGQMLLKEMNISDAEVKTNLDDLIMNFSIGVKKDDTELLSLINEGLLLIMADGTYERLYKKWFEPKIELTRSKLIAGGDSEYPPYSFLDEKGNPSGYDVDLMRAVAKELGILIDIQLKPWSDVMTDLKENRIDFIQGILKNKQREKYLIFSTPNALASYVVFARKGTIIPEDISRLTGKVIIQENDYFYDIAKSEGYFKGRIINVHSHNEAVKKLSSGEADYAVLAKIPALNFIKREGIKNILFSDKIFADPFWCSAAKHGNENLIVNINNALANLKASGEYEKIYSKWFGAYEKSEHNYRKMVLYSLAFLIPLLVLVIVVITWNRTLKRKVEERTNELKERESLLFGLFDNMPSGSAVYQVDNNGESGSDYIVKFFNKKSLEIEKKSMDQVLGKSLKDLRPEIDNYGLIPLLKKVWETGNPEFFPAKVYVDENYSNYYENYTFKLPSGDVVTIYDDVTEKETALGSIKESEEKYRKMFDNASVGIAVVGLDKKFISCNTTFCNFTGYSENELIGKTIADITHPEDLQIGMKEMKMIIEGKLNSFITQKRYIRQDGMTVWGQINISLVRNSNGEPAFFLPVLNDITEMKQAEDKLKETAEELRQMNSFMVDRELKMVELKEEINELLKETGRKPKY